MQIDLMLSQNTQQSRVNTATSGPPTLFSSSARSSVAPPTVSIRLQSSSASTTQCRCCAARVSALFPATSSVAVSLFQRHCVLVVLRCVLFVFCCVLADLLQSHLSSFAGSDSASICSIVFLISAICILLSYESLSDLRFPPTPFLCVLGAMEHVFRFSYLSAIERKLCCFTRVHKR
ncbi:outer membrane protein assembly factor BamA [Sesbania bispinosa]|nr:outer membrane protein assembly factor BamA [Sesbania bispinosa]